MRHIKTFILHLYTDLELREKTCGNLQALPEPKTYSFKDDKELLNLLQHLANEEVKDLSLKNSHKEYAHNVTDSEQPIE